ncbi:MULTISPECIES: hypothetical protein [Flexistipes]|nr:MULTISPECIES: hypothetical protein [Flexistipes]MEC9492356.1 hypothetical protein [Flexistipes sp.]
MEVIKRLLILMVVIVFSTAIVSCEGCSQNNPTSPEKTDQQS